MCLALDRGRPGFVRNFTCSVLLGCLSKRPLYFTYISAVPDREEAAGGQDFDSGNPLVAAGSGRLPSGDRGGKERFEGKLFHFHTFLQVAFTSLYVILYRKMNACQDKRSLITIRIVGLWRKL